MSKRYIKIISLFVILTSMSCCNSAVMTRDDFYAIELGTSTDKIVQQHGQPYSIRSRKDGTQEYRYIERLPVGDEMVEHRNYVFLVKNGQIVAKRFNQEFPPAYDEIYDDDPNDVPN